MRYTLLEIENRAKAVSEKHGIPISVHRYGIGLAVQVNGEDRLRASNTNSIMAYLVGLDDGMQDIRDVYNNSN